MSIEVSKLVASHDATSNLFEVKVYADGLSATDTDNIKFRINKFNPPRLSILSEDTPYKGHFVKIPSKSVIQEKTFDLEIRMDAQYIIYKKLLAIRNKLFSPEQGVTGRPSYLTVEVVALASPQEKDSPLDDFYAENHNTIGWRYYDVVIENIIINPLSHDSSGPSTATIYCSYSRYTDLAD